MRKTDPLLARRPPSDPISADDDDATRPVPLQLIARLAAKDPTVQLKIGVIDTMSAELQIDDEAKKKTGE